MKFRLTKSFLYSLFLHLTVVALAAVAVVSSSGGEEKGAQEKRCRIMLSQVCDCAPKAGAVKAPEAVQEQKAASKPKPKPQKKVVKREPVEKVPAPVVKKEVVPEPPVEEPVEAAVTEEEIEVVEEVLTDDAPEGEAVEAVAAATDAEQTGQAGAPQGGSASAAGTMTPEDRYIKAHIAEIMALLKENLYYPRMARKRGIQGTVRVQFELLANGEINNITIVEAERDILASATVTTIERMEGKFPLPSEPLLLNVPVLYQLH